MTDDKLVLSARFDEIEIRRLIDIVEERERNRIIKKIEEEKKMWLGGIRRGIKRGLWVYVIKCECRVAMLNDIIDKIKEGVEDQRIKEMQEQINGMESFDGDVL